MDNRHSIGSKIQKYRKLKDMNTGRIIKTVRYLFIYHKEI